VRRVRRQQRQRRESVPVPTVALVGYTNAGKSTLFNQLTGAQVLQSPKMFATLDPKLRVIDLPSRRQVLLSDTVGFIRNLPHTLVTSFRATLEEVAQAEVLLHIRDAASTYGEEQKSQVEKVLDELDCLAKPRIEVLNKIDLLGEHERQGLLERSKSSGEVAVSARTGGRGAGGHRSGHGCAFAGVRRQPGAAYGERSGFACRTAAAVPAEGRIIGFSSRSRAAEPILFMNTVKETP